MYCIRVGYKKSVKMDVAKKRNILEEKKLIIFPYLIFILRYVRGFPKCND